MASEVAGARAERAGLVSFLAVMLGIPALLIAGKAPGAPTAAFLTEHLSLVDAPRELRHSLDDILLVPLGALVVVVFRLTLGVRVLGPFRSILLAFGFMVTGIPTGLLFFAATVGVLLAIRPLVRALRLPYFGRVSVMLSAVAMLLVTGAIAGMWIGSTELADTAHFPIVVLCLIGEAVAREIRAAGAGTGLSRAATTALVAVAVAGLASIAPLRDLLARYPELLLAQTAAIVLVARFCAWRLLAGLDARLAPPRRTRPPRAATPTVPEAVVHSIPIQTNS